MPKEVKEPEHVCVGGLVEVEERHQYGGVSAIVIHVSGWTEDGKVGHAVPVVVSRHGDITRLP